MEKIIFEAGTQVSPAKVNEDGSVTPAVWEGNTPLSPHTLNLMQENIENEINDSGVVISPTEPTEDRKRVWIQKRVNLVNLRALSAKTQNGLTWTPNADNQTIDVFGTATGYSDITVLLKFIPSGNFVISLNEEMKDTKNIKSQVTFYKDGEIVTTLEGVYQINIADYDFDYCNIAIKRISNVETNESIKVQVEYGETATKNSSYVESKIYTKNDNDKYELFMEEDVIVSPTEPTKDRKKVWMKNGKNLFNSSLLPNQTRKEVTISFENSVMSISGTSSGAGAVYEKTATSIRLPKGTYTWSLTKKSGTITRDSQDMAIYLGTDETTTLLTNITMSSLVSKDKASATFELTEEKTLCIYIYVNGADMLFSDLVLNVQIEQGSIATGYEDYVEPFVYVKNDNDLYERFMKRIERKALWKNSHPTNAIAYTAELNLASDDYDELEFYCAVSNSEDANIIYEKTFKGRGTRVSFVEGYSRKVYGRTFTWKSNTQFEVSECYQWGEGLSGVSADNTKLIPLQIIGIKY